jgi:hypothetical protein
MCELARGATPLFVRTIGAAIPRGRAVAVTCPGVPDDRRGLRKIDRHRGASIESLLPMLSCQRCRTGRSCGYADYMPNRPADLELRRQEPVTDPNSNDPLHRAKIIASKAAKALAGEAGGDVMPALAMLTVGTLQQNFHDIEDARAILQQIHDFEDDFLNDAFPGGVSSAEARAAQAEREPVPPELQAEINEHILAAQQLAARIEAAALRDVDIDVAMYTIAFLATHLAVTSSDTIAQARERVDAIHGTAVISIASTFAAKQHGMTRQ